MQLHVHALGVDHSLSIPPPPCTSITSLPLSLSPNPQNFPYSPLSALRHPLSARYSLATLATCEGFACRRSTKMPARKLASAELANKHARPHKLACVQGSDGMHAGEGSFINAFSRVQAIRSMPLMT